MALGSLGVAAIVGLVPILIWKCDRNKIQQTKTEVPQLEQLIQQQSELQHTVEGLQRTVQFLDTGIRRIKILK